MNVYWNEINGINAWRLSTRWKLRLFAPKTLLVIVVLPFPRNVDTYASLQHKSKSYRPFFLQIPQSVLRETFIFPIIDYSCHIYITLSQLLFPFRHFLLHSSFVNHDLFIFFFSQTRITFYKEIIDSSIRDFKIWIIMTCEFKSVRIIVESWHENEIITYWNFRSKIYLTNFAIRWIANRN